MREISTDVCVYSGAPAGLSCAIRAAREGLEVVIVTHTPHLGGMLTSGLCVWDTQWEGHRAPIYDELRQAFFAYYRDTYGHNSEEYHASLPQPKGHSNGNFEPHVARTVIERLVAGEPRISVERYSIPFSVNTENRQILSTRFKQTQDDSEFIVTADQFIDASYEGDLMALCGCKYRTGRESSKEYGEPHAGRIFVRMTKQATDPLGKRSADLHDKLKLRKFAGHSEVLDAPDTGTGDDLVQGYNLRTTLTDNQENQLPVTKPVGYDRDYIASLDKPSKADQGRINRKTRINRPQLLDKHSTYADGSWEQRKEIIEAHWQALQGCLYFLRTDESVPADLRKEWQGLGIAADEFTDNNHRPYEIYARETRRLQGRYVFTGNDAFLMDDLDRAPVHATSIAVTEWYIDSHACSFETYQDSRHEGKVTLHCETFPGMVPYEALLPKEIDNLLVVNCVSSSHVGWNTIRLEPTWMNIGEAAGWATVIAQQEKVTVSEVNRNFLTQKLASNGVMVSFFNDIDVASREAWVAAVQFWGTQGFFANYDARPKELLTKRIAGIWVQAVKDFLQNNHESMKTLRELQSVITEEDEPITGSDFMSLISDLAGSEITLPNNLTRGDGCRILFDLVKLT